MRKLLALTAALALASLGLAACGGDDESTTSAATTTTESTTAAGGGGAGGGGGTISIAADPSGALAYTETSVSAPAGDDTIEFENQASTPHDVTIEDADGNEIGQTETITGSSTSTTVTLEAGDYTFYCSVDSHREQGMEGTLTVD